MGVLLLLSVLGMVVSIAWIFKPGKFVEHFHSVSYAKRLHSNIYIRALVGGVLFLLFLKTFLEILGRLH